MRITASEAYQLLLKDVVCSVEDWNRPENRWVKHCVYVGEAAGRIAECLGVDSVLLRLWDMFMILEER